MENHEQHLMKAEALRRQQDYEGALPLFQSVWEERKHPRAACGYAHILRKTGKPDEAESILREALTLHPEVTWIRQELVWALIAGTLKQARYREDWKLVQSAVQEILDLSADDPLPRRIALFGGIEVAKKLGRWRYVVDYCSLLDVSSLPKEKPLPEERKAGISEREKFYFALIKALMNLKGWQEAREWALKAVQDFPRRIDFPRWAALALVEMGGREEAMKELDSILSRYRREWYVLADRAEMLLAMQRPKDALADALEAAQGFGEDKAKVNLFFLIGRIYREMGDKEKAFAHCMLARLVRTREGWSIPGELKTCEQALRQEMNMEQVPDRPLDELLRSCRDFWKKNREKEQKIMRGTVAVLPPGKNFGFIKPEGGGGNLFFQLSDLPKEARSVGAPVEFVATRSFDQKKGKESIRAMQIKCAGTTAGSGKGSR